MSAELDRWAHGVLIAATGGTEQPPDWLRRRIDRGLGGVCLFGRNVVDVAQVRRFTDALRAIGHPGAGPVVAIDEEGGDVTRLHRDTGSPHLGALTLGGIDDPGLTRATYASIGDDLAAAGVDWDFAPVADVAVEVDSPVIGVRSFGADPALVSRHVVAAVGGLHEAGILATLKHFPGHGATATDSHLGLPRITLGRDELDRTHLAPYAAALSAADSVMLGHLVVETLDDRLPASVSPAAVRLVREELGFGGVLVTDALEMHAVADAWTIPGAAVLALRAGVDALCLSGDLHDEAVVEACVRAIVAAVASGELAERRLAEAAAAVARLPGRRAALAATRNRSGATGPAAEAADRCVRVRGDARLDPGPLNVVVLDPTPNIAAGRMPWHPGDALVAARPGSRVRVLGADDEQQLAALGSGDPGHHLVVVVRDLHRHASARAAVVAAVTARPGAVVVELGLPVLDPGGRAWVTTRGASKAATDAVARRLLGSTA